ncbi:MAG: hypothetical protein WAJ85_10295 [Candidatus Baltobacteraceae bacterium]|jgi:hypothetical protein
MGKHRSLVPDIESLVRSSRVSAGSLRLRGVPAILAGTGFVILASGVARMLERAATLLPETLREMRELWTAVSAERRGLRPQPAPAESLASPFGQAAAGGDGTGAKRAQR